MSTSGFFSLLKDIITTNMGKDTLPEPWMDKSESQVQKLLELSNNMWQCGLKTAKHFCLMLFCHIMQILQTVLLSVLFPVDGDCVFIDGQLWAGRLASVSAQCCSSLAISFVKSAAGCATTVQGSRYWWHRLYKWGELLESKSICCFVNCNILLPSHFLWPFLFRDQALVWVIISHLDCIMYLVEYKMKYIPP